MRIRVLMAGMLAGLLVTAPLRAQDHLVSSSDVNARLAASTAARALDRDAVEQLLARPETEVVAKALGTDVGRVKAAVASLDDRELADLAVRAAALERDPAAGHERWMNDFLVIFLVVAIVVLVLNAVN